MLPLLDECAGFEGGQSPAAWGCDLSGPAKLFCLAGDRCTLGESLPGRGFKKLEKTSLGFDPARGGAVYVEHCAACHGTNGQGQGNPDGSYAVPPLWGAKAYIGVRA